MDNNNFWIEETQAKLLDIVQLYPEVWDKMHEDYYRRDITQSKWNEIGEKLGISGEDASHKFSLIRRRCKRFIQIENSGKSNKKPFCLPKYLPFLRKTILDRNSTVKYLNRENTSTTKKSSSPSSSTTLYTSESGNISAEISSPSNCSNSFQVFSSSSTDPLQTTLPPIEYGQIIESEENCNLYEISNTSNDIENSVSEVNENPQEKESNQSLVNSFVDFMTNAIASLDEKQQIEFLEKTTSLFFEIKKKEMNS